MDKLLINFSESLSKNKKGIALILISAVLCSVGQLFWKLSAGAILFDVIFGFFCYGMGAIIMIIAFKYGSLSVLHPMLSVSYFLALGLGVVFLGEAITYTKAIGIIIIFVGVILIATGDN